MNGVMEGIQLAQSGEASNPVVPFEVQKGVSLLSNTELHQTWLSQVPRQTWSSPGQSQGIRQVMRSGHQPLQQSRDAGLLWFNVSNHGLLIPTTVPHTFPVVELEYQPSPCFRASHHGIRQTICMMYETLSAI